MKTFVAFCLRRPITTLTMHILLLLGGFLSLQQIPLSANPEMQRARINVNVPYPNASPLQVENVVIRPLEEALATLRTVRRMESEAREGDGRVELHFDYGEDLNAAKVEIRERVARAMADLPVEDIEQVRIRDGGWHSADAMMEARISATGIDLSENYELLVDRVQRPLERLDGVGQVEMDGVSPLEVQITFEKEELERHRLTLNSVSRVIQGSNIDVSVGRVWSDGKQRRLRLVNALDSIEDLRALPLNRNGLRLGQVARIEKKEGKRRSGRHLNGSYAVSVEIFQESGANTVAVCNAVRLEVSRISEDPLLGGINVIVWRDQGKQIVDSLKNLRDAGLLGSILAICILLLFLRRISATILVGIAIPISVLSALAFLHFLERELNVVTIMALMLGVGMLVDTAVVVVESIVRRAGLGDDPDVASTQGTLEVATPIFAATVTTMVVFLPVAIAKRSGFTDILSDVGLVICLTIGASLFVSLTLVPMVAARIYSGGDPGMSSWFVALRSRYSKLLALAIRHRMVTILLAIALTMSAVIPIQNGFRLDLSDNDRVENFVTISFRPSDGLDYQEVEKYVTQVEKFLEGHPVVIGDSDVYSWFSDNYGMIRIYPQDKDLNEKTLIDMRASLDEILPQIPGVRIRTDRGWGWGGRGRGSQSTLGSVEVRIFGDSSSYLEDLGEELALYLQGVPGVVEAEIDKREGIDELRLIPDENLLARLEVSGDQVARTIGAAFGGSRLRQLRTQAGDLDIQLGLDEEETDSVHELRTMRFPLTDELELPINEIGSLQEKESSGERRRWDRLANLTVSAQYQPKEKDEVISRVEAALASFSWPTGYTWDLGEGWAGRWRNRSSFSEGILLSIFLVYLVLACLFESLRTPLVLMLTVLLAAPGVIWVLWLQGDSLDNPAAVGLILLAGIVVNNGIVMIDHVLRRIRQGEAPVDAVLHGASDRLRPILITAMTTVLGLMPMAYGSQMLNGPKIHTLGRTIVGGLSTSTLLTLVVLPVVLTFVLRPQPQGEFSHSSQPPPQPPV